MIEKEHNSSADRMPVVFVGHGSPMNAAQDNQWSRGFVTLRDYVPKPAAILAISAHWYVSGTYLTSHLHPPILHDFGGFPRPLYELEYPAPGHPGLAESVRELLGKERVQLSEDWGLDHGIWSVLRWMYAEADVPVVQLSINRNLNIVQHYEIGQSLAKLRDQNVLIFASGNCVHNLQNAIDQMQFDTAVTPDWASRFDEAVKQIILTHDIEALLSIYPHTADAQRAHPTPEHWLPLIYAAGAAHEKDHIRFPTEGFDAGSISMRNIIFG